MGKNAAVLGVTLLMLIPTGCKRELAPSKLLGGAPIVEEIFDELVTGNIEIVEYFVNITAASISSTAHRGLIPSGQSGPRASAVPGTTNMINGGSNQIAISGGGAFEKVYFSVIDTSLGARTVLGYYELPLSGAVTSVDIIINVSQTIPATSLTLLISIEDTNGNVGPTTSLSFTVLHVGSGDVQVSLSWDTPTDVDLHVVDPSGDEVYYGNTTSVSGGVLDLDSNPACNLDNKNNENITWPTNAAPIGTYIVRVDYWSSCSVTEDTQYIVTVSVVGSEPKIFTGSFTSADADAGGLGSGVLITTFTKGIAPSVRFLRVIPDRPIHPAKGR